MKNQNYDRLMEKVLLDVKNSKERKKLLMHACCAPCSSSCIERLKDVLYVTVYFYNPNMDSYEEYSHRAKEQQRLCQSFGVDCVIEQYNNKEFYQEVEGLENEMEGGSRCEKCFNLRLAKTAEYAKEHGFDYFTTTLTVSPLKNAEMLNRIGSVVGDSVGIKFLPSDFKKRNGYLRSIELSKEYELYRQNYCGCEFSKNLIPSDN